MSATSSKAVAGTQPRASGHTHTLCPECTNCKITAAWLLAASAKGVTLERPAGYFAVGTGNGSTFIWLSLEAKAPIIATTIDTTTPGDSRLRCQWSPRGVNCWVNGKSTPCTDHGADGHTQCYVDSTKPHSFQQGGWAIMQIVDVKHFDWSLS